MHAYFNAALNYVKLFPNIPVYRMSRGGCYAESLFVQIFPRLVDVGVLFQPLPDNRL